MKAVTPTHVPRPLARNPENDKVTRASGVSSMVEAGQMYLPLQAPWLEEFEHELLAFPNARHDDQVDALSQLLERVRQKASRRDLPLVAPEVPDPTDWSEEDSLYGIDPWLDE